MNWQKWALGLKQGRGQKRTAKALGITEGAFTGMLWGRIPTLNTLNKIASAQNRKTWELLKEVEEHDESGDDRAAA